MRTTSGRSDDLRGRVADAATGLAALSAEAARTDPALRARLDAALRAIEAGERPAGHAALLKNPADPRGEVRDVVADELDRYWRRRFGRTL